MNRYVFLLHRYAGMALGLVISLWCLSGIVMMYVQYPEMSPADKAGVLERLDLAECCQQSLDRLISREAIDSLRIEAMRGIPVLRIVYASGNRQTIDLRSGTLLGRLDARAAADVAGSFARVNGIDRYRAAGALERDQWTVYGAYNAHRPLYKFIADDNAGTQWYVSSVTGEVVQTTTAYQRFWNWFGAVPHWLYPTVLRQHTFAWSQTVIWLTILATFLTLFGVYVGLRQLRSRRSGRYSPYRGAALWHHYAGLFFGGLMLTWLVSGFFSMNPWGALESRGFEQERIRQQGTTPTFDSALIRTIEELSAVEIPVDTVRVELHVVNNHRFFVHWNAAGERGRLDESLASIGEFSREALFDAANRMRPTISVEKAGWLDSDDAYYFSHHDERPLPVFRIVYSDGERFYLDGLTGEIVYAVDRNERLYRWLHYALHRGDFTAAMRARPVWDAIMLPLMLGVSISALTGAWMGLRRVRRWYVSSGKSAAVSASVADMP